MIERVAAEEARLAELREAAQKLARDNLKANARAEAGVQVKDAREKYLCTLLSHSDSS